MMLTLGSNRMRRKGLHSSRMILRFLFLARAVEDYVQVCTFWQNFFCHKQRLWKFCASTFLLQDDLRSHFCEGYINPEFEYAGSATTPT